VEQWRPTVQTIVERPSTNLSSDFKTLAWHPCSKDVARGHDNKSQIECFACSIAQTSTSHSFLNSIVLKNLL